MDYKGICNYEFGTYTDAGGANRFEAAFGNDFKWVEDTEKWVRYNEKTGLWEVVSKSLMLNKVAELADILERDKLEVESLDDEKGLGKFIRELRTLKNANAILEYSKYRLRIKQRDFDSYPYILGLPAGKVMNLATMQVESAERKYLLTKTLAGSIKDTVSQDFMDFITKIFTDEEVLRYVQKFLGGGLLGYQLRHSNDKTALFVDSSCPNTGKSTFLSMLEAVMKDYYENAGAGLLTNSISDENKPNPILADLRGARVAGISELSANQKFAQRNFKSFTGNDTALARYPYDKKPFRFKPDFRILVVSNYLPQPENAEDEAFKARMRRITLTEKIKEADVHITEKFKNQDFLDDCVTWLVEGCKIYKAEGLDNYDGSNLEESNLPAAMKTAIKKFYHENDDIGDFFKSFYKITCDSKDFIPMQNVYQKWKEYTDDKTGFYVWGKTVRESFKRLGLQEKRKSIVENNGKSSFPTCIVGLKPLSRSDVKENEYSENNGGKIVAVS